MAIFNLNISGPPPGSLTVGASLWIDLGLITSGKDFFIGNGKWTSPDKTIIFSLRTNNLTKSAGTTTDTTQISTYSVAAGKSYLQDLYKSGRIHTATVKSTGVEHWWLLLTSKSSTAGSFMYNINYCLE